jgi:16S rRNA (guanine527-N7)-methyltransferase
VATVAEVLEEARELGFLGPGPVGPHITHALGFAAAFSAPPGRFVDLGSGGGLPGLVLAELWPDAQAVLLDSMERRTGFLAAAVEALGWGDRVEVVRERAEVYGREHRAEFDAAVARGFAPPPVTAECAAPLLRMGGLLVVSEPPEEAGRWPADAIAELGLAVAGPVTGEARYQVLRQVTLCPEMYPRRVGVPGKRPLW